MSNTTPQQPQQPAVPPARRFNLESLAAHRQQIAWALLILAALFAVLPISLSIRHTLRLASTEPLFVYGLAMALSTLSLAVVCFSYSNEGSTLSENQKLRLVLLTQGALSGLFTALLGFVLPFTDYSATWGGGLDAWREKPAALIWPAVALVGGLGLMFASLQLGRGMEREHQRIRQLIYGFNAILMCVLLLAVLAIPSVLAYAEPFTRFFGRPYDWTGTDVNTISQAMRNVLANLKEPIKVYAIMPRNHPVSQDTQTLLENCRSLSPQFTWELIDAGSPANRTRILGFMERYSLPPGGPRGDLPPTGLLVLRGVETDKGKSEHVFVKFRDLYSQESANQRGAVSYAFRGENALYNALYELLTGKLVLYFTQGHGEMSLGDAQPAMPRMRRGQGGDLSVLKGRLTERKNVEVKPLTVDRSLKHVPDDASVVVVVRPTQPFTADELKVLREYVKRPGKTRKVKDKDGPEREEEEVSAGKLFLMLEPIRQKQNDDYVIALTGLEPLMAQFNVKLGRDRILSLLNPDAAEVRAISPMGPNPIARAFRPAPDLPTVFVFRNVRTVDAVGERPGAATVEQLLLVPKRAGYWAETNASISEDVARDRLDQKEEEKAKLFASGELCMAVAVSDTAGDAPHDMAHAEVNRDKQTPRMVVFGTADWLSDDSLNNRGGTTRLDLFNSCVSWLREKSSIGKVIPDKKRKEYELNLQKEQLDRLYYLPLLLMMLGIVGLGTGVWVVRRR